MGLPARKSKWSISDELWALMEPLFPKHKNPHPRGGGRKRVNYREVMNGIFSYFAQGVHGKPLMPQNMFRLCSSCSLSRMG